MTVVKAVTTRILSLSAVTAIVAAKVYVDLFPQDFKSWPAVRAQRIDEFETIHLRGAAGPLTARVQVDSVATTKAAATALDEALHGNGAGSGLSGWQGVLSGYRVQSILPIDVRDLYDADAVPRLFTISRDYRVVMAPI